MTAWNRFMIAKWTSRISTTVLYASAVLAVVMSFVCSQYCHSFGWLRAWVPVVLLIGVEALVIWKIAERAKKRILEVNDIVWAFQKPKEKV